MGISSNWERWVHSRRSEEHTSELQSHSALVCRLLLEKKKPPARNARPSPASTSARRPSSRSRRRRGTRGLRLLAGGRQERPRARPGGRSFFFNETATTEIYTLSLHDALPI